MEMKKAHIPTMALLAGLLAACNSSNTESALNVQGSKQNTATVSPGTSLPPATAAGQNATQSGPQPILGQQVRRTASLKPGELSIASIIGAPVNVVTPLTQRINDDAKAMKIDLAATGETGAAYVMKGYFSVLSENNQTSVLYVWDVLDAAGNRLHRIQGQEKVQGAAADGWSIVPASAMQAIADRTMQDYSAWLAANRA